jgi:hypothetical protein
MIPSGSDVGWDIPADFQATFIVDSDAALAAWANNTAGNDYTSVFISAGTFASGTVVNLTNAGTKQVLGAEGSKLVFSFSTSSAGGLLYTTAPNGDDFWIKNLSIETTGVSTQGAFRRCTNLVNCVGTGVATGEGSGGYGFSECNNLVNCTGTGVNTGIRMSAGFSNCTNLEGCHAYAVSSGRELSTAHGFYRCSDIKNCTVDLIGIAGPNATGFQSADGVTNCVVNIDAAISGSVYGFNSGKNVTGCSVFITSVLSNSYGFASVRGMTYNHVENNASPTSYGKYSGCYVSIDGTGPAPSNTEEGGWNS